MSRQFTTKCLIVVSALILRSVGAGLAQEVGAKANPMLPDLEALASCPRGDCWRVSEEMMKVMTPETCLALARALQVDERFRQPIRRGRAYEVLETPVCEPVARPWQVIVEDLASDDDNLAGAAHDHLLGSPPAKSVPFLADAFVHQPRFQRAKVRRMAAGLFIHLKAGILPEANDALLAGVTDDDGGVQSACALAISRGSTALQIRALEVLAPIWRSHRDLPTFRVARAIRCALLFGNVLKSYTEEFERLLLDPSVDEQIRSASGGAIFHAGLIRHGLDLFEQLETAGKVILIKELKNVGAQRHDFLMAEPDQEARLRRTILSAIRSDVVRLRQAALTALPSAFPEGLLAKNDVGEWDFVPEVRESLEYIVANDTNEELVKQAGTLLDPKEGLNRLIKVAEEREARPKAVEPIILIAMESPDTGTRKAALESLFPGGGLEGYLIIRSREDYELNPKMKAALTAMATSDPDPSLRERAAQALEREYLILDEVVEKVIRQRERQRKDVDE